MTGRSRDITGSLPRRAVMRGVAAGPVAALLAGAAGDARAAEGGPFPSHPRWRFVFVNHVTANPFFVPCQYGIQDACALLGCDYQWTGSETSDVAQMVNAMNTAVAGKADAMTAFWAICFFWLRLAHAVVYLLAIPYVRTLIFTLGFVAVAGIFWEVVK